jgi:host factor-I protein
MTTTSHVHDSRLTEIVNNKTWVAAYLINGLKIQGRIEAFDNDVIFLTPNGITQMMYRHAISVIIPSENTKPK